MVEDTRWFRIGQLKKYELNSFAMSMKEKQNLNKPMSMDLHCCQNLKKKRPCQLRIDPGWSRLMNKLRQQLVRKFLLNQLGMNQLIPRE